ncbi:helix-turn-helix domain-containing protein [Clostridium sp. BJN0001]|uniref:helix-turn-helix domain-containing protein n=1 Tax=Clostridium sp. BJN0001 TaxID=2930219 RepID=UPI001FD23D81|nr:helix-turn-helix domain-containing protein [Clostridium sp. BJN0001]
MNEVKAYYAIIPAEIRYDDKLKDKAKLLYGEITALTNDKGYCWASNSYFAELYKVTKETISRLIKNLSDRGYIRIEMVYKNREIIGRKIYIQKSIGIDKNINTSCQENQEPIDQKVKTLLTEKSNRIIQYNNTINTTVDNTISKDIVSSTEVQRVIDAWNGLNLTAIKKINSGTIRYKLLHARVKEYGIEDILKAIENIKKSSFLKGQNNRNWIITFDWFIKPNNFPKVLEGNYITKETPPPPAATKNEPKKLRFNNFKPREYDYDDLEKKLLGWDKND